MKNCRREHFEEWARDLENEPGLWCARDMNSDQWFRNGELRQFLGGAAPKVDWESAACRALNGSREMIETAHARALRNRTTEAFTATIHAACGQPCEVVGSATASFCQRCGQGCGVIVQRLWPVTSAGSETESREL